MVTVGGTEALFALPSAIADQFAVHGRTVEPPGGSAVPDPPLLREPLIVDPVDHAAEIARFYSKVVAGPGEHCAIWTGSISDDGYGTFSITRFGVERTVKAHRYAAACKLRVPIKYGETVEHKVCDMPICCRADPDPLVGHVWPSTQADNLRRMALKKRGGRARWWIRPWWGLARHERAERSRALAAAVRSGWDEARVRAVLLSVDPTQIALF